MNRRDFLSRSLTATTLPVLLGGFTVRAFARSPILDALLSATAQDRVLVLVQLTGGNDGLNTVIPLDQYSALSAARANIMIDSANVLKLTAATGLHPGMTGLLSLYQNGSLAIVQGVSYPNPNFSHFRATDIWVTGADYNQVLTSGWLGRYLDDEFPGYPTGYPSATNPDPPGIQIGSVVSSAFDGSTTSMALAITNPTSTYTPPGGSDTAPATPAGHELTFIRIVAQEAQAYTSAVKNAAAKVKQQSSLYPAKGTNALADQLKIVAQLIAGGLRTRLYVVSLGGFDTHSAQVDSTDTTKGTQATLLTKLSVALSAFMDDITTLGVADRVIGMTFSEFGRRIRSNASYGTDHGTAEPVFVFGKNVKPGLIGSNPVIPTTIIVNQNDNLPLQYDFRRIYATLLQDWFGVSSTELNTVMLKSFPTLPLIADGAVLSAADAHELPRRFTLDQNYPNPFNPSTTISYQLPGPSKVNVTVYDALGRQVGVLVDEEQSGGAHMVHWDGSRFSSGTYFCRLIAVGADGLGAFTETRKMVLLR